MCPEPEAQKIITHKRDAHIEAHFLRTVIFFASCFHGEVHLAHHSKYLARHFGLEVEEIYEDFKNLLSSESGPHFERPLYILSITVLRNWASMCAALKYV